MASNWTSEMCCEIIEHGYCSASAKFHIINNFCNCFNTNSVSDGAMASRFNLYKSSVSVADSKKLCDMSLREIKFTHSETKALS